MQALKETNFNFEKQTGFYRGKVRDVYYFQDKLAIVATDRISAFDVVLPRAIPYKGQVLNQIAATFLKATADIVPNWVVSHPFFAVLRSHRHKNNVRNPGYALHQSNKFFRRLSQIHISYPPAASPVALLCRCRGQKAGRYILLTAGNLRRPCLAGIPKRKT